MVYQPSAHPGCLAPHLWLADGSSLYDRLGPGLTLLVLADGHEDDVQAFVTSARLAGIPLTVVRPGDRRLPPRYGAPLALIRPDQHVAWRGSAAPPDTRAVLDTVRGGAIAQAANAA